MKMNHRFLYGILSIVLAAVIAFIAIPAVTSRTNSTCEIVRMKTAVPRGKPITADDLEVVEVGGFNLPDSVARKVGDVAGTYAAADLYPGDYILPEKVSSVPLSSDLSLNGIPDGMLAISSPPRRWRHHSPTSCRAATSSVSTTMTTITCWSQYPTSRSCVL